MKRFSAASILTFLLFIAFSIQTPLQANDLCTRTLASKSGTVYAGGPVKINLKPTSSSITVKVNKTDGKAQTIVNIYVNNVRKGYIQFNNGKYTTSKSKTISGVKGKSVRVEVINQSVGNKFKYSLTVKGVTNALGSGSGNLAGQVKKTITFDRACKNNAKITVRRTNGNARANVYFYRNNVKVGEAIMDPNQTKIERSFGGANGKTFKVEVKNISVGNTIRFSATGTQS